MNQCPEMAIGEGFWNVPNAGLWTVKSTLKRKLGFEGETLCQEWSSARLAFPISILRTSDPGKDKSIKGIYFNPLTKSYVSSAPRIPPSDTDAHLCMGFGVKQT